MKRKTTLSLMELAIMVAVFALAAAICLRAFVWADVNSGHSEITDWAASLCQTTAERIKAAEGDGETRLAAVAVDMDIPYGEYSLGYPFQQNYNEDFSVCQGETPAYCLVARPLNSGVAGLGKAEISVTDRHHSEIYFHLEVCWQEVSDHA